MDFSGFTETDFAIFTVEGLHERMDLIRKHIQPKFFALGNELVDELSIQLGYLMYLHIAQHRRRTVHPPQDTWLAIVDQKRGYKKYPHFQVGLFDDHVFVWLAYLYELERKYLIGQTFIEHIHLFENLPSDLVISLDHTKKTAFSAQNLAQLEKGLLRFRDTKKGEFLIGKQFHSNDPLLQNSGSFIQAVKEIFHHLLPLYQLSMKVKAQM